MPKTTATQRQRRQKALASMLYDDLIEGKFKEYHGNPMHAPKRWKRLWRRQARFVRKLRFADRLSRRHMTQRAQAQQKGPA